MTRNECLLTLNEFFEADVTGSPGYWNMSINSNPPRCIVLEAKFVEKTINQDQFTTDLFRTVLAGLQDKDWGQDKDGTLWCGLGEERLT